MKLLFFRRPAKIKKKNPRVLFSYFCRAFPRLELFLSFLRKTCPHFLFLGFCKRRKRILLAGISVAKQKGSGAA